SGLELQTRHESGLEDTVLLAVVLRPVGGQNPSVRMQATERRSSRHRHDHTYGCDVHTGFVEEVDRAAKDSDVVLIEAEHDPKVDRDRVAVKLHDETAAVLAAIVCLVRRLEPLLRDRLEAHK